MTPKDYVTKQYDLVLRNFQTEQYRYETDDLDSIHLTSNEYKQLGEPRRLNIVIRKVV